MDDIPEGSSSAAHRAHGTPPKAGRSGFFSRLIGAISPGETDDRAADTQFDQAPRSLLNLRRMRLEDVAVPKVEIVAVPLDIKKEDLVERFRESGMTRLPVYDGTLDTPVGLIHLKDFALEHGFNGGGGTFKLQSIMRELLFAPPSMPIGILLQKMQTDRIHMALVIDEYGGVDGLVTIEDLIEQVIGEIEDEHDIAEGKFWTEEKPGCYLAQAKTPLDDFEAMVGLSLTDHDEIDSEDVDTLGGIVFMLSGKVPARGEMVSHPAGVQFEVVDADPRRIKRLRVRMPGFAGE